MNDSENDTAWQCHGEWPERVSPLSPGSDALRLAHLEFDGVRLRTVLSNTVGENLEAEVWAGAQRLGLDTAQALALEAVPCDHGG